MVVTKTTLAQSFFFSWEGSKLEQPSQVKLQLWSVCVCVSFWSRIDENNSRPLSDHVCQEQGEKGPLLYSPWFQSLHLELLFSVSKRKTWGFNYAWPEVHYGNDWLSDSKSEQSSFYLFMYIFIKLFLFSQGVPSLTCMHAHMRDERYTASPLKVIKMTEEYTCTQTYTVYW